MNKTLSGLLLCVSSLSYADPISIQFDVEATIPSSDFYVLPEGGWNNKPMKLDWNSVDNRLNNNTASLRAKNTNGAIEAWLDTSPAIGLVGGMNTIPLDISIGGKPLKQGSINAIEIVDGTTAASEQKLMMSVGPQNGSTYTPGDYLGSVTMVFDATVTP